MLDWLSGNALADRLQGCLVCHGRRPQDREQGFAKLWEANGASWVARTMLWLVEITDPLLQGVTARSRFRPAVGEPVAKFQGIRRSANTAGVAQRLRPHPQAP